MIGGIALIALVLGGWGALEIQYRCRPRSILQVGGDKWGLTVLDPQHYQITGTVVLTNNSHRLEVMVPELTVTVKLLSQASLSGISQALRVVSDHPDVPPRPDGYWFAYIVKSRKTTRAQVTVDLQGEHLAGLQAAWIRVHYVAYGPQGRVPGVWHGVVPLQFPAPRPPAWRPAGPAQVLPIHTHLLTAGDDPVEVVRRYVLPYAGPADIVTMGESPVAIMQGRWRHPTQVHPGWVARRLCYYFLPTSSLATACGLQTLVDQVGPVRVLLAFAIGALARKILGRKGVFYQLAGEQARLIDDVTGTLPPYDQFIVLGPEDPQAVVDRIAQETGLAAAIVDVNDLKAVKILAATKDVSHPLLAQALVSNPAGNGDEQTPVVLIRSIEP